MDDIKKLANKIARRYRSRNPFEIIKGMNVILVYADLEGVRGFYQYFQRNHIIYIDNALSDHKQRFVCAHELGHLFLHKKVNAIFMDTHTFMNHNRFEKEANRFAIELLLPDELLAEYNNYTAEQLARILGYQQKIIELKLDAIASKKGGNEL